MSTIARRIEKLEKLLSAGKERNTSECIISIPEGDGSPHQRQRQDTLGPPETWLTCQEQLATAREDQADHDHKLIMIGLSVDREVQAREFQNSPLAEEKRAERIQEYRTVLKDRLYPKVAPDY